MDEYSVSLPGVLAGHKSTAFESLVRRIGESKSKHEEDKVIEAELLYLKQQLVSARVSSKKSRELLVRVVYCEMLGHDGSFGYIHAIKMSQQTSLIDKKTGYLAASIFLNKNHELVLLLINTLQKDLQSTNVVAKSAALNAICKLISDEMTPALLPLILPALKDKRAEIRKKALLALQQVYKISPSLLQDVQAILATLICDSDPSVVAVSLHFFYDLAKQDPGPYRRYLKAFIQILTQIMESKLSGFNYHGVQAPWLQTKLLKILALLGKQDKSSSESMSSVLSQLIHALPTDCNIGCAVMYECIQTITTIYPIKSLLDVASRKATLFLTSDSSNLKCLGISAVTSLAEIDPCYAADSGRQKIIISCLENDDMTIKKKTLELMYRITDHQNVDVVCSTLLNFLSLTTEHHIKTEVTTKLIELAEKYAPTPLWYIQTINNVIPLAHQSLPPTLIHTLMKTICSAEDDVKRQTVLHYVGLIDKKSLPDCLTQLSCWVIGEFAHLLEDNFSLQDILCNLSFLLDGKFTDPSTAGWVLTAVAKLTARMKKYLPEARGIVDRYRMGFPPELRQRCHEISILANDIPLMNNVLRENTNNDVTVCSSLSFLDDFVSEALLSGARPYQPYLKNKKEMPLPREEGTSKILTEPYERPFRKPEERSQQNVHPTTNELPQAPQPDVGVTGQPGLPPRGSQKRIALVKNVPAAKGPEKVWGREGYLGGSKVAAKNVCTESVIGSQAESSSLKSSGSSESSSDKGRKVEKKRHEDYNDTSEPSVHPLFAGLVAARRKLGTESSSSDNTGPSSGDLMQLSDDVGPPLEDFGQFPKNIGQSLEDVRRSSDVVENLLENIGQSSEGTGQFSEGTGQTSIDLGQYSVDVGRSSEDVGQSLEDIGQASESTNESRDSELPDESPLLLIDDDVIIRVPNMENVWPSDGKRQNYLEKVDLLGTGEDRRCYEAEDNVSQRNLNVHPTQSDQAMQGNSSLGLPAGTQIESKMTEEIGHLQPTAAASNQSDTQANELCSDSNLRLVYKTVYQPTELVLEFKLTNHSQSRDHVTQVCLTIEPPSNLQVASTGSCCLRVESLAFLETISHSVALTCQYPALHMSVKGTVNYIISKTSKVLYFSEELSSADFLRPYNITTQEFGEKWTSMNNDVRQSITMTSSGRCDDVIKAIADHMNLAIVDIIGREGILAATVLGKSVCLLHVIVDKNIDIWVKSSSQLQCEVTMKHCVTFLKEYCE